MSQQALAENKSKVVPKRTTRRLPTDAIVFCLNGIINNEDGELTPIHISEYMAKKAKGQLQRLFARYNNLQEDHDERYL